MKGKSATNLIKLSGIIEVFPNFQVGEIRFLLFFLVLYSGREILRFAQDDFKIGRSGKKKRRFV